MPEAKMLALSGSDIAKIGYDLLRPLVQENDLILVDNDRE